jgi:ABC-2 type transport system ATP-binding protein
MRKRFSIAVSMMANPQNLVLDEVLNGLDPGWIRFARDWMLAMRQQGRSVLLSSHLLGELQGIADEFAILHQGRLLGVFPKASISASLPPRYIVRIANIDAAAVGLLGSFGRLTINPPFVTIDEPRAAPEAITAELGRRNYLLQEFRVEEPGLEEFFFRLIGSTGAR